MIITLHRLLKRIPSTFSCNLGLYTTKETLEQFIVSALRSNLEFVSIENYIINKNKNNEMICLTFDDGYIDTYTEALPFLEKLNIPFTIYVTTNYLNNFVPWWFSLEDYVYENYREKTHKADKIKCDNHIIEQEFLNKIYLQKRFEIMKGKFDISILKKYESKVNSRLGKRLFINKEELITLNKSKLVTIGSHTLSHPRLSKCNLKESEEEIYNSKLILENILKKEIKHFAYPYGGTKDFRKKDVNIIRKSNYSSAVTTIANSFSDKNKDKIFMLNRYPLSESSNLNIKFKDKKQSLKVKFKNLLTTIYKNYF